MWNAGVATQAAQDTHSFLLAHHVCYTTWSVLVIQFAHTLTSFLSNQLLPSGATSASDIIGVMIHFQCSGNLSVMICFNVRRNHSTSSTGTSATIESWIWAT